MTERGAGGCAGNRDYAPYLAVGGALAWWRAHGGEARLYMRATLRAAAQDLQRRWRSGLLAPLRLCEAMACVELPASLQSRPPGTSDSADAKELQVRHPPPPTYPTSRAATLNHPAHECSACCAC